LKRSQAEMIYDVLEVLRYQRSVKLTHIMYKVNMNCLVLRDLLRTLQNQGYVTMQSRIIHPLSKNKPRSTKSLKHSEYSLTAKGLEFCKALDSTMKALNNLIETHERERYIADAEKMKTAQTQA
jgi:predicted transcriptional regulator